MICSLGVLLSLIFRPDNDVGDDDVINFGGYKRKPPIERNDRVDLSDTGEVQGPGNFGFLKDFATCGIIVPMGVRRLIDCAFLLSPSSTFSFFPVKESSLEVEQLARREYSVRNPV